MDEKEKTVQIVFHEGGGATISYFVGDDEVGEPKQFDDVPKRLSFFLEKFPTTKTKGSAKSPH